MPLSWRNWRDIADERVAVPDIPPDGSSAVVEAARRERRMTVIGRLKCASFLVALLANGCHRDPHVAYARLLERTASWAASVQFTAQMARARNVPPAHVHDVLQTAATELDTLGRELLREEEIDRAARKVASDWCRRLAAIVQEADRANALPDERQLRDIEMRLRDAARAARAGSLEGAP
jgi:hypothetical protein